MSAIDDLVAEAKRRAPLPPVSARKSIRLEAGLSQSEVAEVCGVDRATISRWESGERVPHGVPRGRYAQLLRRLALELVA